MEFLLSITTYNDFYKDPLYFGFPEVRNGGKQAERAVKISV